MKTRLIVLAMVLMLGFSFTTEVIASDGITVTSTESVYVAPNAEFYVDVKVESATDLVGFQMKLIYDATQFTFESIEKSSALGNNITVNSSTEGVLILNYVDVSKLIAGDVDLFRLTFIAKLNVSEGSQAIVSIDESYNNEFIRYTSSTITKVENVTYSFNLIKRGLYGDVNLDETISIMDAAIIQLYIANLTTFTPTQTVLADVNGDGLVSVTDVALIQLYLAGLITSLDPS